jgi:hypothetical protein
MERMSDISYHLIRGQHATGVDNVVALFPDRDKPIQQADSRHPHWQAIVEGLQNNDDSVYELFDVQGGLVTRLTKLSDRISFDGENILFDGDVQSGPLADHLLRCLESGVSNYAPVVKFWEKVAQNPDQRSREQLFTWLQSHEFTITEEGDILGYKGVNVNSRGEYTSVNTSGAAYVDGVLKTGGIPNVLGATITMPRSEVKNDPNAPCHKGLHVGDWSYANGFGPVVLEVHVNPRDVVSIPRDASYRKMRCCRYVVVKVRTAKSGSPIEFNHYDEWDDVGYVG